MMIEVYARRDLDGPVLPGFSLETRLYDEALSHYYMLLGNNELRAQAAKVVLRSEEDRGLTRSCWLGCERELAAERRAFVAMQPRMGD